MKNSILFLIVLCAIWSCNENGPAQIEVEALPVNAQVTGDVLSGPSALNDPDRFVWGGSVVKGDDGK